MSARLLIVGCGASKTLSPAPASSLYTGPLFRAASGYARSSGNRWLILSALHGAVDPSEVLAPYDFTMSDRRRSGDASYPARVRAAIMRAMTPGGAIEVHAGSEYVQLVRSLDLPAEIIDPLSGLMIGQRLHWYAAARLADGVRPASS